MDQGSDQGHGHQKRHRRKKHKENEGDLLNQPDGQNGNVEINERRRRKKEIADIPQNDRRRDRDPPPVPREDGITQKGYQNQHVMDTPQRHRRHRDPLPVPYHDNEEAHKDGEEYPRNRKHRSRDPPPVPCEEKVGEIQQNNRQRHREPMPIPNDTINGTHDYVERDVTEKSRHHRRKKKQTTLELQKDDRVASDCSNREAPDIQQNQNNRNRCKLPCPKDHGKHDTLEMQTNPRRQKRSESPISSKHEDVLKSNRSNIANADVNLQDHDIISLELSAENNHTQQYKGKEHISVNDNCAQSFITEEEKYTEDDKKIPAKQPKAGKDTPKSFTGN